MNYGLSFGEGVLRTEILVEIDGYLVRGKFTAPLARMRRGGKHDLVLVASDFKAAPGDFHRQPAGAVGWRKVHLDVVLQQNNRLFRAVDNTHSVSLPLWETERDWFRRGSFSALAVERQIPGGYVNRSIRVARRRICAGQVDLNIALAPHRSCRRLITALARVYVVVAIARAPVNGDPNIFQKVAVLSFVFGRVRSSDGENRAVAFYF